MIMDEENNDEKKGVIKIPVAGNGSTATMGPKKMIERRQLPALPSHGNGTKIDGHAPSTFARQVVSDARIPQLVTKSRLSSISTSSLSGNKVISSITQASYAPADMKKMIDKALKARLYFLQQTGPHQFLIGGDSLDHKYRVTIGSQKCSCGKDSLCVHILFVMLRVFQVSITDPILAKRTLKNFEVEALLRNFSARRRSKIKAAPRATSLKKDHPKSSGVDATDNSSANCTDSITTTLVVATAKDSTENVHLGNENNDEETCPICLLELVECESLTECKDCQNKYHQHCIDIWTQECSQQKEPIVCPLCRATWKQSKSSTKDGVEMQEATSFGTTFLDDVAPDLRNIGLEWLKTFSVDIVQKLISKNWTDREIGLRHFSEGVLLLGVKTVEEQHESYSLATFESAMSVLSHLVLDPVYKVFVAALRAFRNILLYTPCQNENQQNHLRFILRPFIVSLFVKCSDSNKKTGQLAISTLEEFIKGQEGELAVGKGISGATGSLPLGDLNFLLSLILSSNDNGLLGVEEWALVYGKLIILNRLLQLSPEMFLFSEIDKPHGSASGYSSRFMDCFEASPHTTNKNLFLDFSMKYLPHSHVRISKASRNILSCITRLNAEKSNNNYHHILSHVSNSPLIDSSLKEALLSKLLKIEEEIRISEYQGRNDSPGDARRMSVPSIQVDRNITRSRPNSSRANWYSRSGSFKNSSESNRRIKSSTASPVKESWPRRSSTDRRRCLKKNLSISDDSVFVRSTDSSLTPEMILSARETSLSGRYSEYAKCSISPNSLYRSLSEFSFITRKQNISKGKGAKCKTKFRDVATSTSPPINPIEVLSMHPINVRFRDSNAIQKPSKLPPWKETNHHRRQCSAGSAKDFDDMVSSTPISEKVSFKTEVATTPHSSPQSTLEDGYHCKEEVDKEEAEALARALDISDMHQEALPFVPGLSASNPRSMSQSLLEELKETKISWTSFASNGSTSNDVAAVKPTSYEENTHWKRGPIIGSGAACTCYQARDIKTGTLMAVKLISFCRNTVEEQDKVKKLIVDEVQTMAQLSHPNIVRILGATLQSTHVFMFFEWMPGRSISSLLELYGPFSETVVTKYTLQILRGLLYLHDNHILHRDLKGANILVDSTGQKLRIGDFGTSARLSSSRTMQGEFQGQLLGTVAFMAPEVLRGADYGRSCDIWSMGCCVIEMLTGSPPWVAKHLSNHLALMFKIASSDKPPPIPDNLNPALKDFLLRCLDINPSDRPFAKDLLKHPLFRV